MTKRTYFQLVVGVALGLAWPLAPAQYGAPAIGRPPADTLPGLGAGHGQDEEPSFSTLEMQARQAKRLREEHQKQVVADSARLVQLATALKAETDKGLTATPGELKDVDEIARLARKVTERIKTQ